MRDVKNGDFPVVMHIRTGRTKILLEDRELAEVFERIGSICGSMKSLSKIVDPIMPIVARDLDGKSMALANIVDDMINWMEDDERLVMEIEENEDD